MHESGKDADICQPELSLLLSLDIPMVSFWFLRSFNRFPLLGLPENKKRRTTPGNFILKICPPFPFSV